MKVRDKIIQFEADLGALGRLYPLPFSPQRADRMRRLYESWLEDLDSACAPTGDLDDEIDFTLFRHKLLCNLEQLKIDADHRLEVAELLPFEAAIFELENVRRKRETVEGKRAAEILEGIRADAQRANEAASDNRPGRIVANRAFADLKALRTYLEKWFKFQDGYDPLFSWWAAEPYRQADAALESYAKFLREDVVGAPMDDDQAIVGNPIGRDAIVRALEFEMIESSPEELIATGDREYAWCLNEMEKASTELGFTDWHDALEHVKSLHVQPGEQPGMVRELAYEAIEYLEAHDLLTISDLAKETWRMEMMSAERQKVNPFFLGGEAIIVSYPTNTMTHDNKLMSLRGNNRYFARATVQHELIPGHHMQFFSLARFKPYRDIFQTPFWIEGWALHWEMLLWDLGFPSTPEEKIGMLFWRMHRCARITFSLRFHLGEMSAEECIQFLVERVGHEPFTAEGEVRRSLSLDYEPLYQLAYMIGGLQMRALHKEMIALGVSHREFHDEVLRQGGIPIAVLGTYLRQWAKQSKPL